MTSCSGTLIPRMGIPLNIGIAFGVGVLVAVLGQGIEHGISTGVLFGICIGILLQELILVQILSREANINFQHRILNGDVTSTNRGLLLFGPLGVLLAIGFSLALLNGQALISKSSKRRERIRLVGRSHSTRKRKVLTLIELRRGGDLRVELRQLHKLRQHLRKRITRDQHLPYHP